MRIYLTRRQCELVISQLVKPAGRLNKAERAEVDEVVDRIKRVCAKQAPSDNTGWSGSLSREFLCEEVRK